MRPQLRPLVVVVLLAGCGVGIQYVPLNQPPYPPQPRPAQAVEVFNGGRPQRPFVEIGMIESRQESQFSQSPPAEIIQKMREAAGANGCDALVLTGSNDAVVGSTTDGQGSTSTLKGYRGSCVVYTEGGPPAGAPPQALWQQGPPPQGSEAAPQAAGCNPPCSPGYSCEGTTCRSQCNPACQPGSVCNQDRICVPAR